VEATEDLHPLAGITVIGFPALQIPIPAAGPPMNAMNASLRMIAVLPVLNPRGAEGVKSDHHHGPAANNPG